MKDTLISTWMEVKVKYEKEMEDGLIKSVAEQYAVDADTFTEGELRTTEDMRKHISGDFKVAAMGFAPYHEVLTDDDEDADKWYKVKVNFVEIDDVSGKEKKIPSYYLVQAESVKEARNRVDDEFAKTTFDYIIASVAETKILGLITSGSDGAEA